MNDKTIADWLREEAEYNHERLGSDMLNEAADTIEAQATRIEALEAALRDAAKAERDRLRELAAGPAAWLGRWAKHVGDCQGGCVCSCGLTLAQMEAEQLIAALESKP